MGSTQFRRENVTIVMAGGIPLPQLQSRLTPEPFEQQTLPPLATQAANIFQSVVAFVGDGCALVDDTEYRQRLETCHTCDRRSGKRCTACGCWINVKARGRAFSCPLGRWQ